jgi:hypothetical protein
MSRNAEIQDELEGLESLLATLPREMPFAVPEGYFNSLAESLSAGTRFAEMEEPATQDWPTEIPFQTPPQYFIGLAEELTASAHASVFSKADSVPYEVPAGYVESLPSALLRTALSADNSRVKAPQTIAFVPSRRRWAGVAAAAVLLLALSLGSYRYYEMHTPEAVAARQLSRLDAESISSYVEQHVDDFDGATIEALAAMRPGIETTLPLMDADEIEQYLNESGTMPQVDKENTL